LNHPSDCASKPPAPGARTAIATVTGSVVVSQTRKVALASPWDAKNKTVRIANAMSVDRIGPSR